LLASDSAWFRLWVSGEGDAPVVVLGEPGFLPTAGHRRSFGGSTRQIWSLGALLQRREQLRGRFARRNDALGLGYGSAFPENSWGTFSFSFFAVAGTYW